jgi:hypothetical protein
MKSDPPRFDVEAETLAFLESDKMDLVADYSARGRAYQHLPQDELIRAWMRAFEEMADAPTDPIARQRQEDLSSEIRLRGNEPPYADVKGAVQRFIAAVKAHVERVKADPEAMKRMTDSFAEDLADFWSRRGQNS